MCDLPGLFRLQPEVKISGRVLGRANNKMAARVEGVESLTNLQQDEVRSTIEVKNPIQWEFK